jgi:hypothetical protein
MPIAKFRDVSEVPRPTAIDEPDLTKRIRIQWARALLLCPRTHELGVRRFRSLDEANEARVRETVARMRATARTSTGDT